MDTRDFEGRQSHGARLAQSTDCLEYLAQLISELKKIADKAATPTLAGLLDLAHKEAKLQGKKGRRMTSPRVPY